MTTTPTNPASDINDLDSRIRAAHAQLQAADRALDSAVKKAVGLRAQQQQRRLELGRLLVEARDNTPHGEHGQWGPYLVMVGIDSQRASEYMRIARRRIELEAKSPATANVGDLRETLAEAGIDKRARKPSVDRGPPAPAPVRPAVRPVEQRPTLHVVPDRGPTADDARRELRKAVTWALEGGHAPEVLLAHLGAWSRYEDEGRHLVAAAIADELRALLDVVEGLP